MFFCRTRVWSCEYLWDLARLEPPLWNRYYTQQLWGLLFQTNRLALADRRIIPFKKICRNYPHVCGLPHFKSQLALDNRLECGQLNDLHPLPIIFGANKSCFGVLFFFSEKLLWMFKAVVFLEASGFWGFDRPSVLILWMRYLRGSFVEIWHQHTLLLLKGISTRMWPQSQMTQILCIYPYSTKSGLCSSIYSWGVCI